MLKGIHIRLYPNTLQASAIQQNIGNTRFVWNQMLGMWNIRYQNNPTLPSLSVYDLNNLLPTLKSEYAFLKESESSSLQAVNDTLMSAFKAFFEGKRKHPRFKSKKHTRKTYTVKNNRNITLTDTHIKLPKLGWLPAKWSKDIAFTKIKRVTVTYTASGHYEAAVLVESENQVLNKTDKQIGLDVGQIDLAIGSDGLRIPTKTYKHYEEKLILWQRKMARRLHQAKEKGVPLHEAKNYQQAKRMVAKYHEKIRHCRKDYLHKVTKHLVTTYDLIAVEDLKVTHLMSKPQGKRVLKGNHHKIANQSWYLFRTLLEYKCQWYGKTFIKVDSRYTSQDCSHCGYRTGPKGDLKIRTWVCTHCHETHDRDINAGKNILNKALIQHSI